MERLSENLIFVKFMKFLKHFLKALKVIVNDFLIFRRTCEQACLLESLYEPFRQ